jgi:hypothetical protein
MIPAHQEMNTFIFIISGLALSLGSTLALIRFVTGSEARAQGAEISLKN